jgi:hypothetical protein
MSKGLRQIIVGVNYQVPFICREIQQADGPVLPQRRCGYHDGLAGIIFTNPLHAFGYNFVPA